jgi:hypothetical protein
MWLCLLSTTKGLPTPKARVAEMREAQAKDDSVRLILPSKAKDQFSDAEKGEDVVFGVRQGRRWSVYGRGRIAGEIALVDVPAASAGAPVIKACACPLDEIEFYEPPRDESDFGLPEGSWPIEGRPYATWVDDPESGLGQHFARSTVPRSLYDEGKRREAGVPADEDRPGSYIVELNVAYIGGLPGAAVAFKALEVKRIFLESATPLGRERYFEGRGLLDLMRAIQSV